MVVEDRGHDPARRREVPPGGAHDRLSRARSAEPGALSHPLRPGADRRSDPAHPRHPDLVRGRRRRAARAHDRARARSRPALDLPGVPHDPGLRRLVFDLRPHLPLVFDWISNLAQSGPRHRRPGHAPRARERHRARGRALGSSLRDPHRVPPARRALLDRRAPRPTAPKAADHRAGALDRGRRDPPPARGDLSLRLGGEDQRELLEERLGDHRRHSADDRDDARLLRPGSRSDHAPPGIRGRHAPPRVHPLAAPPAPAPAAPGRGRVRHAGAPPRHLVVHEPRRLPADDDRAGRAPPHARGVAVDQADAMARASARDVGNPSRSSRERRPGGRSARRAAPRVPGRPRAPRRAGLRLDHPDAVGRKRSRARAAPHRDRPPAPWPLGARRRVRALGALHEPVAQRGDPGRRRGDARRAPRRSAESRRVRLRRRAAHDHPAPRRLDPLLVELPKGDSRREEGAAPGARSVDRALPRADGQPRRRDRVLRYPLARHRSRPPRQPGRQRGRRPGALRARPRVSPITA